MVQRRQIAVVELTIRKLLRIYAQPLGGTVYHYRDDSGLEVDAIVELGDGRWSAFEVKLGGTANIEKAAASLRALKAKVSEQRARQLATLNVVTAGAESYTRPDGVNVIALGHLFAGQKSSASATSGRQSPSTPRTAG